MFVILTFAARCSVLPCNLLLYGFAAVVNLAITFNQAQVISNAFASGCVFAHSLM